MKVSIMHVNVKTRDWSLVMSIDLGRATKWEIHGQKKQCKCPFPSFYLINLHNSFFEMHIKVRRLRILISEKTNDASY